MKVSRFHALLAALGLAALSAGLTVLLAEGAMRLALPTATSYRVWPPGLEVRFDPDPALHPGIQGPSFFRVNSVGLRGQEWGGRAETARVLCLGGSTTESLINDQGRTWTALLEQTLGRTGDGRVVRVGNGGRSGLSSEHHVLQMRHLPPVLDPDLILILVGVNDLSGFLRAGSAYDPHRGETVEGRRQLMARAFAERPGSFGLTWAQDPWWKRTRVWAMLRLARTRFEGRAEAQDQEGAIVGRWRAMRAAGRRTAELPPLEVGLERYRRNLLEMVHLARQHGVELAFLTQPVLWRAGLDDEEKSLLWMGGVGDFRRTPDSLYYEPEALARGMRAYNDVLRDVCSREALWCVDLAEKVPRTTEHFYDDCHFTDAGQELVASEIASASRGWLERANVAAGGLPSS